MTVRHFSPNQPQLRGWFCEGIRIQYSDKDNQLKYVHQTSWGMTTRMIGAIIMIHGDNEGLDTAAERSSDTGCDRSDPPAAGGRSREGKRSGRGSLNFRVKVDDSDKSPGWKFSESEMRGIGSCRTRTEGYRGRTGSSCPP